MDTAGMWSDRLREAGLQPSYNRISVLRFIHENPIHPNADEIYAHLHPELPSLSRTTVYNTLRAFVEKRLLRDVRIEEGLVRYDANTAEHGHFKCEVCGVITDLPLGEVAWPVPDGASVTQRDIFERGVCRECRI